MTDQIGDRRRPHGLVRSPEPAAGVAVAQLAMFM
jgi:hypothetical protein